MQMDFLKGLTGKIIFPTNASYKEARQEWNRAIQKFPLLIVYCLQKRDVKNAILWARKNDMRVRIRSGGHHYEGYSIGNGVLVIDVSKLNKVELSGDKGFLKVEGGAQNKNVVDVVGPENIPFPAGTCPTVGVSGYTLGGGWGYSSRYLGLGCDSLVEVEMVNYKGEVVIANKSENSDLFWAFKGAGGGNFGVVVSLTFQLPKPVAKLTLVEFFFSKSSYAQMEEYMEIWQRWLRRLDSRMTLSCSLYEGEDGLQIYTRGYFYGVTEEAEKLVEPFRVLKGGEFSFREVTYQAAAEEIFAQYPPSEKFKSTGRFVDRLYSKEEIRKIVYLLKNPPKGSIFASLSLYALGGEIEQVRKRDTAFYYRDASYILGLQSVWEEDQYAQENKDWVVNRFPVLASYTMGSFVNFPFSELPNYEEAYYGQNAMRLNQINKKYDPENFFTFPQGLK